MAGYRRVQEARSPEVSAARMSELAGDEIRPVRLWVARSRRCPPDVLARLAQDEDRTVRWNALLNGSLPEAGLRHLSNLEAQETQNCHTPWFFIRSRVLAHPNVSRELADELHLLGAAAEPSMLQFYARQAGME